MHHRWRDPAERIRCADIVVLVVGRDGVKNRFRAAPNAAEVVTVEGAVVNEQGDRSYE